VALQDEVAAARRAVAALESAATYLRRHYGDTLDARRLEGDVARLSTDLDLLCGPEQTDAPRELEVIPDTEYSHDFWMDAEDEGLGSSRPAHDRRAP
jgi:hypothetical protein